MTKWLTFAAFLFPALSLLGDTHTAANASRDAVGTAVGAAANGDTVDIPAGTATWATALDLGTKAITLRGAGSNDTIITHNAGTASLITFQQHSSICTRITGMKFLSGTYDRKFIGGTGSSSSTAFRIDHNSFSGSGNCVLIEVDGNAPGVIDHCYCEGGDAAEMIHNSGMWDGAGSGYNRAGWNDDVVISNAVYIEDCRFHKNDQSGDPISYVGTSALQSYYGARTVFRYNKLDVMQIDQHGTPGAVGARWWEVYMNTWELPAATDSDIRWMDFRAGSGVVWSNGYTGRLPVNAYIVFREEDSGTYPIDYQIGVGKNGAADPAYCWYNNANMQIAIDSPITQNRDVFLSAKSGYTPYTYPHPLVTAQDGGGTAASISVQPQNQAVQVGQNATFTVTAAGDPTITYQWKLGGANIANATTSAYATNGVALAANGNSYTVGVSNSVGGELSSAATLTVTNAPAATVTLRANTMRILGTVSTR